MKKFLQKLAYYDGDKYLKRALGQETGPVTDITGIKTNWKLTVTPALSAIASLQTKIDDAIKSISSETGAWGWMTGTNESYRTANQYLNEAKERVGYLDSLLKQINENVESSSGAEGIGNLATYSEYVTSNLASIKEMINQVGRGEISGNSDITEYLIPVQESVKALETYCQRLSQILTSAASVAQVATQNATQQQQGQQTNPQSPESAGDISSQVKKEWVNEKFPDNVWNQDDTGVLEDVKYHTTGDKIFIQQVEEIKNQLPTLTIEAINNTYTYKDDKDKYLPAYDTQQKRVDATLKTYNEEVDDAAGRMRALIDKRKTYLNTLKSQGKLDEAAYKGLMETVTLLESTIPTKQNSLPH